jgi:hypothetical protein
MTKENIYDSAIAPLMTQVIELCKEHKINMFVTFVLRRRGRNAEVHNVDARK